MEWLWGAAALPLLACGAMCLGGMALAAIGLRRGTHVQRDPGAGDPSSRPEPDEPARPAP